MSVTAEDIVDLLRPGVSVLASEFIAEKTALLVALQRIPKALVMQPMPFTWDRVTDAELDEARAAFAREAVSGGDTDVIQFVCYMRAMTSGASVLVLRYPETGFHPYALRQLMHKLDEGAHSRKMPIIIETHSPVILRAMEGIDLSRVYGFNCDSAGNIKFSKLTNTFNAAWLAGMDIGDLYANGNF